MVVEFHPILFPLRLNYPADCTYFVFICKETSSNFFFSFVAFPADNTRIKRHLKEITNNNSKKKELYIYNIKLLYTKKRKDLKEKIFLYQNKSINQLFHYYLNLSISNVKFT